VSLLLPAHRLRRARPRSSLFGRRPKRCRHRHHALLYCSDTARPDRAWSGASRRRGLRTNAVFEGSHTRGLYCSASPFLCTRKAATGRARLRQHQQLTPLAVPLSRWQAVPGDLIFFGLSTATPPMSASTPARHASPMIYDALPTRQPSSGFFFGGPSATPKLQPPAPRYYPLQRHRLHPVLTGLLTFRLKAKLPVRRPLAASLSGDGPRAGDGEQLCNRGGRRGQTTFQGRPPPVEASSGVKRNASSVLRVVHDDGLRGRAVLRKRHTGHLTACFPVRCPDCAAQGVVTAPPLLHRSGSLVQRRSPVHAADRRPGSTAVAGEAAAPT